jgi:hypothetical protein
MNRLLREFALFSLGLWIVVFPYSNKLYRHTSEIPNERSQSPQVNVPYLGSAPPAVSFTPAIFWLGKVDPTHNYADVRMYYYDEYMKVVVHTIDRRLWSDPSQKKVDLEKWDAVTLYLDLHGNNGSLPDSGSYRLEIQLDGLKAAYRGNGSGWTAAAIPFSGITTWRGDSGPNSNADSKGWEAVYEIPFQGLGLSTRPAFRTRWGLAVAVHDRDTESGYPFIPDQTWPETFDPNAPSSWGQMHFGIPGYSSPPAVVQKVVTIRDGLNGSRVKDAHVGGHTTCGADIDHWTEWGDTNYAGYPQINIQNQWDIADWPCFSKYYLTFPLDSLPAGKVILSAKLTMVLFGNAGGGGWGEPPDSYIQVLTVNQDWDEETITWNNAPLAWENISGTWVKPRDYTKPDQPYQWDVSRAVDQAYQSDEPLRLALYSADGERHSGKYFWSSDTNDWGGEVRPTLQVMLGEPCTSPDVTCRQIFLPLTDR